MNILNIAIACMTETFNGTFIDHYIPNYENKYYGTQEGKELYIKLLQDFQSKGFTHVLYEGYELMIIQDFIRVVAQPSTSPLQVEE
tara:strand:- start:1852 stop:2109 length:258 start_codon:yes stop_codon:yes gene_type:complete